MLVLFTCKSKGFGRWLCPEGLLHQHDYCCQIPTLSEPRMSWTTKSMRGPYPQALGTFYTKLTSMNSGFHSTGLWHVTVLQLSRTHIPVMQCSLKIKFHLILLDFWNRAWMKWKQPFYRIYQHLIPKHFSNVRCSFFLDGKTNICVF